MFLNNRHLPIYLRLLEFQGLFPDRDLSTSNLTIITLSQKTENDMTSWSAAVEEERELLLTNVKDCG